MQALTAEMNVYEAILARRSVRSYLPKNVSYDTIRNLIEAAIWAPTAMHEESWVFVIIQDKALLKSLSDRAKPLFVEQIKQREKSNAHYFDFANHSEFNIFYDAGTLIIICANTQQGNVPLVSADCWLAAENLMLAACAANLGSCVIGAALPALAMVEHKAELGIPANYEAIAPIILGYPAGDLTYSTRKPPIILTRH